MLLSLLLVWVKIAATVYFAVSRFYSSYRENSSCQVGQNLHYLLLEGEQLHFLHFCSVMDMSLEANVRKDVTEKGTILMTPETTMGIDISDEKSKRDRKNADVAKSLISPNDGYFMHDSAGYVAHDCNYKCVWQNYNGSIVAGTNAIVFTGSFFLFEKSIVLPWDNIRQVVLMDGCNIDNNVRNNNNNNNGIEIILTDNTVHSFVMNNVRNGTTVDKVWLTLISLHNDALFGRDASSQRDEIVATPRNYKRRNSDPASQSKTASSLFSPSYEDDEDDLDLQNDGTMTMKNIEFTNRPVIGSVTSMADSLSQDFIMLQAGQPLRLQPIHCSYGSIAGRLYIGNNAIFFTGKRYYFWEHLTVTIPWSSVRRIQVHEKNSLSDPRPNVNSFDTPTANVKRSEGESKTEDFCVGLSLTTKDAAVRTDGGSIDHEPTMFEFCKVESPERVWASLVAIQNEKLLLAASTPQAFPALPTKSMTAQPHQRSSIKNRRKSHRRMNSDPMRASHLNFEYSIDDAIEVDVATPVAGKRRDEPHVKFADASSVDITQSTESTAPCATSSNSFSDAWKVMKNQAASAAVYDNVVVSDHELHNCTVGQFFEAFLADSATYSLAHFLEQRGDYELRSTEWQNVPIKVTECIDNVTPQQQTRVVRYMHPVNVPMAPPQAGARKEQTLRRYGDVGIVVETQTFVDDVPMTDCFYVADRLSVEASNENSVTITIEFGITFVKSTMFRGIISKKTSGEVTALCKAMAQYMTDAVEVNPIVLEDMRASMNLDSIKDSEDSPRVDIVQEKTKDALRSQSKAHSTAQLISFDRIVLLFVVIIQLWILMELRGLKYAIGKLELEQEPSLANVIDNS